MAEQWPLVTGVFLSYNTGTFVVEAILSTLANNYPNLEIICIDDASTDDESVDALQRLREERDFGTLILNARNLGIPRNLNIALQRSHGKYLFFLGDDLITKTKIWDDVQELERLGEGYAVVHSQMRSVGVDGMSPLDPRDVDVRVNNLYPDCAPFDLVLKKDGIIAAPTAMMRRSSVEFVGGWDESLLYEDKAMWLALAHNGYCFRFRPEVTVLYRRHSNQATALVRQGSITYQMRVFSRYDQSRMARKKMRRVLLSAAAARLDGLSDLEECLVIYAASRQSSRVLYLLARSGVLTVAAALYRLLRSGKRSHVGVRAAEGQ